MLTLKQINDVSFRKSSFSGYKPEDVDDFIDEVTESFTTLLKESQAYKAKAVELAAKNGEMREKMVVLAEKVETYRNEEEGIKNALLSAQKLASASLKEAKNKAESIISDSTVKANDILDEAKHKSIDVVASYEIKIAQKQQELETLKSAVTAFRSSLYDMYRNHLSLIEKIPDFSQELEAKKRQEAVRPQEEAPITPEEMTVPMESIEVEAADESEDVEVLEGPEAVDTYIPEDLEEFSDAEPEAAPAVRTNKHRKKGDTRTFGELDLNAFADIPESLKKEKATLYSTLEFGEDIDIKR